MRGAGATAVTEGQVEDEGLVLSNGNAIVEYLDETHPEPPLIGRSPAIRAEVLRVIRCGWARPREVERVVGKITHWLLLHRPSLALLNAVYAFCRSDSPDRPRR